MAQETLDSLIQVMLTLSLQDQERVILELQNNIKHQADNAEPTNEQKARLRNAYRDMQEGNVFSQEAAHRMMDEFVQQQYAMAV